MIAESRSTAPTLALAMALVLLLMVLGVGCVPDDPLSPPEPASPDRANDGSFRFGVALGADAHDRLDRLERDAQADVSLLRVFARWDTEFPTAEQRNWLEEGRVLHLSVRPVTDEGLVIPWWQIAAAEPGSAIHRRIVEWAAAVVPFGSQVYFTLNHEPETLDSAANGSAEDFIGAWRHMVDVLRAAGDGGADGDGVGRVKTVFVAGGGAYRSGAVDRWYPGDDSVDVVGADFYNWFGCQGTDRSWESPQTLIAAPLRFASERRKPLAIPEVASTEDPDDPLRKAQWIEDLGDAITALDVANRIEFVAWFSVHDDSWPNCDWRHDSSPAAADRFSDVVRRFA